jgi:hypothetical protein
MTSFSSISGVCCLFSSSVYVKKPWQYNVASGNLHMLIKTNGCTVYGVDALTISVEVDEVEYG